MFPMDCQLAILLDLYSRRIVGWKLEATLNSDLSCGALSRLGCRTPLEFEGANRTSPDGPPPDGLVRQPFMQALNQ